MMVAVAALATVLLDWDAANSSVINMGGDTGYRTQIMKDRNPGVFRPRPPSTDTRRDVNTGLNYGPGVRGPSFDDIRRENAEHRCLGNWRERLLYLFLYKSMKYDYWGCYSSCMQPHAECRLAAAMTSLRELR